MPLIHFMVVRRDAVRMADSVKACKRDRHLSLGPALMGALRAERLRKSCEGIKRCDPAHAAHPARQPALRSSEAGGHAAAAAKAGGISVWRIDGECVERAWKRIAALHLFTARIAALRRIAS